MKTSKPFFITYTTDLGGKSLGLLYEKILKENCDFFQLDMIKINTIKNKFKRNIFLLKQVYLLRKAVKNTVKNNQMIIFQNMKPALLSYGIWNHTNSILISDFSHSIFSWHRDGLFKRDLRYKFQKIIYNKLYRIIALTDNLAENLHQAYAVSCRKIKYAPLPLDLEYYYQSPQPTHQIPKVLFVGGDFFRKGGNHLLDYWETTLKGKCELIVVTKNIIKSQEGIHVYNNVSKGDALHQKLFKKSDIFILPTKKDAYPVVLGEAAAASMAMITTKFALGAKNIIKDGVSGFIADTPEDCITSLLILLDNKDLIDQFKAASNKLVLENFTAEKFKETFLEAIK